MTAEEIMTSLVRRHVGPVFEDMPSGYDRVSITGRGSAGPVCISTGFWDATWPSFETCLLGAEFKKSLFKMFWNPPFYMYVEEFEGLSYSSVEEAELDLVARGMI